MIASSPLIKALACCGAVAAHAALAVVLLPEPPLATEGAGGVAEVRLGTAFADVSAGTLQARPATAAARPATRTKARQLAPPPEIAKAKTPPRASSTPPAA
ncbi:MAG: energy transducer TonB, partial [Marinovum algicola]